MARDSVDVVRGKHVIQVNGAALRGEANRLDRVVVDLGAGDGRWIYRLAREHPTWLCIGIDANAQRLREASFRAGRKPHRGGTGNVWYLRTAAEALPRTLGGLADEIHIHFPWGSLLQATLRPDPFVLMRIAQIGRPGAMLTVQINATILDDPRVCARFALPLGAGTMTTRLYEGYAAAGIRLEYAGISCGGSQTSWNRRLNQGRPGHILSITGTVMPRARQPNQLWRVVTHDGMFTC